MTTQEVTSGRSTGIGRPPIPHEHGAWVILYAPMVIAAAIAPPEHWAPWALLLVAVTGAYLARNAFALVLRKRGAEGTAAWLGIYALIAVIPAIPLLLTFGRWQIVDIAVLAAILFAIHSILVAIPARKHSHWASARMPAKRLDRSQWGEILAVAALSLTAPAVYIVDGGGIDPIAICLWLSCTLYFSSAVFFVKMLLNSVKYRKPGESKFDLRQRWAAGRDNLIYHILLTAVLVFIGMHLGLRGGILSAIAYGPIILRAFIGWARLGPVLPPLKRVGLMETVYSVWFTVWFILSIRIEG